MLCMYDSLWYFAGDFASLAHYKLHKNEVIAFETLYTRRGSSTYIYVVAMLLRLKKFLDLFLSYH